jgi:hypothetical protein
MPIHLKLEAPWAEVKEKLKEIEHTITDEDLEYEPGQEATMLERLSKKLGRPVDKVKTWVESVSANKGKAS